MESITHLIGKTPIGDLYRIDTIDIFGNKTYSVFQIHYTNKSYKMWKSRMLLEDTPILSFPCYAEYMRTVGKGN